MHRSLMHSKLAEALAILGIGEVCLRNNKGDEIEIVTPREHAKALFTYLNMAGYLSDSLLQKAVEYLSASKPFKCEKEIVISDLKKACESANSNGHFDAESFITHFAKQEYFGVDDIIDLIVFLQQTAFDRQYGVERDRLQIKPWIEEHRSEFIKSASKLGSVTPLPPLKAHYPITGIMGAASVRVRKRLEYFRDLKITCDQVWAFSGNRELSKGLDDEELMGKLAAFFRQPVNYVKKQVGVDTREFLEGITETMMVNYLIQVICPDKQIGVMHSNSELGHWRGTVAQNAVDAVLVILDKIQKQEIKPDNSNHYHFLIIAEQPYPGRMAKQIQREFNKEIAKRNLEGKIIVVVEGCGPGIAETDLLDKTILARLNSELGALMAERFYDARLILQRQPNIELRDPNMIMFSKRDETFKVCIANTNKEKPRKTMPMGC